MDDVGLRCHEETTHDFSKTPTRHGLAPWSNGPDHDVPDHFSGQARRPEAIEAHRYYVPGTLGFEKRVAEWLERLRAGKK